MTTKTAGPELKARSLLNQRKSKGVTVKEFREAYNLHHGTASSLFSTLHRNGEIVRLAGVKRDGYKVYVLPEWQKDRPIEKQGRRKAECSNPECVAMEQMYVDLLRRNQEVEAVLQSRGIAI